MLKPNKDNWLEITTNALEELKDIWQQELAWRMRLTYREKGLEKQLGKDLKGLEAIIKYLNKTN